MGIFSFRPDRFYTISGYRKKFLKFYQWDISKLLKGTLSNCANTKYYFLDGRRSDV
jgi:hypothetical protein